MKYFLSVLFLAITIGCSALQQIQCNYRITGVLKDSHTSEKLSFANIFVEELNSGAISDEEGRFAITGLCNGSYTLKITHVGCHPLTKKVTIRDASVNLDLTMDHSAHMLEGVEISGTKGEVSPGRKLEKIEGLALIRQSGDNLGNALKNITGMNVLQTGPGISKPVIHGLHSNRVLILNNGIRQEGQQWGAEHAPEIDPYIAKKLTVLKGANAIKYGADAIAGVILVEPGDIQDTAGIRGELNMAGASNGRLGAVSGLVEGKIAPTSPMSFRLQGTLRKSGNAHTPDYYLGNTGISERNYSALLGYKQKWLNTELYYSRFKTEIGIFSGSHIGNTTDLARILSSTQPIDSSGFSYKIDRPFQQISHDLFKAKTTISLNNLNRINLVYARQFNERGEFDKHKPRNDSLAALNRPEFEYRITTHTLDLDYQLHNHHGLEGTIGVNTLLQANLYNGRYFIPNFRNRGAGVFISEWYFAGKWQFEAGFRADYRYLQVYKMENGSLITPKFRYFSPSANAGVSYKANEELGFYLNSGSAWRPPAANELFSDGLHHGSATIEVGDRTLGVERAWNSILTTDLTKERFQATLSLFVNRINNYINLVPAGETVLTIRGAFPKYVYVQQNAIFRGIDLNTSLSLPYATKALFQYSMVRANNKETNDYIPLIPPDHFRVGLEKKFIDQAYLRNNYVGIYLNHYNKQTRVPEQVQVRNNNGEITTVTDFAPPPPAYVLLDIEAGTSLIFKNHELTIAFAVENLLDKKYRSYMNRFRYYADDIGRNFKIKINLPFTLFKAKK